MKEIVVFVASVAGIVVVGYLGYVQAKERQAKIDSGYCSLVFTEDDGDEHYRCQDGEKFEVDYD